MQDIKAFKDELRNLEVSSPDPSFWENHREKAVRELRKNSRAVREGITRGFFTPGEVLLIASITPSYVSLTADSEIIDALKKWTEDNSERENTEEVRLYTEEAEKMLSSLFI